MSSVAEALLLQMGAESIADQRERRRLSEFCRLNATIRRALPLQETETNPLLVAMEMTNAFSTSQKAVSDSDGQASSPPVASPSTISVSGPAPATVAFAGAGAAGEGSSSGLNRQAGVAASPISPDPAAGGLNSAASSAGNAVSPWLRRAAWAGVAASILGAGGLGAGIAALVKGGGETIIREVEVARPDEPDSQYEYPLLDWAEEKGLHRK